MKKKLLSVILTFAMALSLCTPITKAEETFDFSDPNVQAWALSMGFDTNGDGHFSRSELTFNNVAFNLDFSQGMFIEFLFAIQATNCHFGISNVNDSFDNILEYAVMGLRDSDFVFSGINYDESVYGSFNDKVNRIVENYVSAYGEDALPIKNIYDLHFSISSNIHSISSLNAFEIPVLSIPYMDLTGDGSSDTDFSVLGHSIKDLDARAATGDEFKELLKSMDSVEYITILPGYIDYIGSHNIGEMWISSDTRPNYENDDDKKFSSSTPFKDFPHLTILTVGSLNSWDLDFSQMQQLDKLSILWGGSEEGKATADDMLRSIGNITELSSLRLYDAHITDLSPLNNLNKCTFQITGSWAAMSYGNNREIYNKLKSEDRIKSWSAAGDKYSEANSVIPGTDIAVSISKNKNSYLQGDTLTCTATLTNQGSQAEKVDLYFSIKDAYNVEIISGSESQHVTLSPGETVNKSISFIPAAECGNIGSDNFVCIVNGDNAYAYNFSFKRKDHVGIYYFPTVLGYNEKMTLSGRCDESMENVEIQLEDGTVLAEAEVKDGYFTAREITLDDSLWPEAGQTSTIKVKAVASDNNETTYSSSLLSITLTRPAEIADEFDVEEMVYSIYGRGRTFDLNKFTIFYQGDRVMGRVKLKGIDENDIEYVRTYINNTALTMKKIEGGRYDGYYFVVSSPILDDTTDYIHAKLSIKKKSGEIITKDIGNGRIIIDPSGIISDPNGNPIEGVKVTLYRLDEDTKDWVVWDAENYLQQNPVYTNENGYYGWDVPKGTYKIIAEKEGYQTVELEEYESRDNDGELTKITIPPPRLDVDFTMEFADPENPPAVLQNNTTAKEIIESKISEMTELPADTDEEGLTEELNKCLTENMYISVKEGTYEKIPSTLTEKGSITATYVLENLWTGEMEAIPVEITLAEVELSKENTPQISIDYGNELLTGFGEGNYTIGSVSVTPQDGKLSIEEYIGTTIQIVKKGDGANTGDSDAQSLEIPARPAAPNASGVNVSGTGLSDGKITGVNENMVYQKQGEQTWNEITGNEITSLPAGEYKVKLKATTSAFASTEKTVTVGTDTDEPPTPPTGYGFNYSDGALKVSSPNAGTYTVIFASYTDGGILKSVDYDTVTFETAEEKPVSMAGFDLESEDHIKVFLWNDLNSLKSMCAPFDTAKLN